MRKSFSNAVLAAVCAVAVLINCGGDSGSNPTPQPSPTAQPTPTPTPTPAPTPTPTPGPVGSSNCPPSGEPGPVAKYAISPRAAQADGVNTDIRVRARPNFDEVWCIDRTKEHRLDFNSTQKNADNRECCWQNDPTWEIVADDNRMVTATGTANGNIFNFRVRINPKGQNGVVLVQATLDGVKSHPWQAGSGYRQEPLAIVAVAPADLADCKCIFRGNGIYEGVGCTK